MVSAIGELAALWTVTLFNILFLAGRLYLRRNLQKGYRLSDYLLVVATNIVVASVCVATHMDKIEIDYYRATPNHNPLIDPMLSGLSSEQKMKYRISTYAIHHINILAVWVTKASFLIFFYEIFPNNPAESRTIRWVLHACSLYVLSTYLSCLFTTIFWCNPQSSSWIIDKKGQICRIKLDPDYSRITFSLHISSVIFIAIVPMLLLGKVKIAKREIVFAFTVLMFGTLSVAAAVSSFVAAENMGRAVRSHGTYPASVRHTTIVAALADQSALLTAATLSSMRLKLGRRENAKDPTKNGKMTKSTDHDGDQTPLVIEVERSYTVQVEMVQQWGQRPRGPITGIPQGFGHENDIEVAQLTSSSA